MAFSDSEFEAAIAQLEQDLATLKERHNQVIAAESRIAELQGQQAEIADQSPEIQKEQSLKTELKLIQAEIENLELSLESSLLNWQEPFWQVVRFVGLGILIGWLLKSFA
ncbi:MAG: hypothetical protein HC799_03455 [Limnothrix sp. RL_2_0]|nr:hypothetical protein [Limnothrix sp. RL_2_0]